MGKGHWLFDIFKPKRPLHMFREDTTVHEINNLMPITDTFNPVQAYLNSIHDITERAGWDIYKWQVSDVEQFMHACDRCGTNMPQPGR